MKINQDNFNTATSIDKTTYLLNNLELFEHSIKSKQELIEEIQQFGLKKTSGSIIRYSGGGQVLSREEQVEQKIRELESSINDISYYVAIVRNALDFISSDYYYEEFYKRYVKHLSFKDISQDTGTAISSIARNNKRLLQDVATYIFSNMSD